MKGHYTFLKVAPHVHIVKLMLLFSLIVIMQDPTTQDNSCQPELMTHDLVLKF